MDQPVLAYVALGGNVGNTFQNIQETLQQILSIPTVSNLQTSNVYLTTPVGGIEQRNFLNAVCRFFISLSPLVLLHHLQEIEIRLGKAIFQKNGPRTIDLDILFYGCESHQTSELQIPHPRWMERLFVLIPLRDLTATIQLPSLQSIDLDEILCVFPNIHNETILPYSGK